MKRDQPAKKTKQSKLSKEKINNIPDRHDKKTKQSKLSKEKIDYILYLIEENQPGRAKRLRKLRKDNPKKFRTEIEKIVKQWASKKERKPKGLARRVRGQGLRGKVQGLGDMGQGLGGRVQGLGGRVRGLGDRGQGLGGRVQGLGGRVQGLGGRVQGLGGRGYHKGMGFGHGHRAQIRKKWLTGWPEVSRLYLQTTLPDEHLLNTLQGDKILPSGR